MIDDWFFAFLSISIEVCTSSLQLLARASVRKKETNVLLCEIARVEDPFSLFYRLVLTSSNVILITCCSTWWYLSHCARA